jgi:mannan endo-1,4-beta-mannosidase
VKKIFPPLRTLLSVALGFLLLAAPGRQVPGQLRNFITASGDRLMDGNEELRFVSFNIPNLHYIEDNFPFTQPNPWRIADEYEIRDALTSIRQMGGRVARMYVPSVRKESDDSTVIRHVLAPGLFSEEAFRAYDKVLEVANQAGVRVIIPLVDNWWWWGGPKEYAAFRGKSRDEFWTDSLLIADFKKTIDHIINRVNTYTGVPFRQDRAILGWETGNELVCPFSWTREIAAYIRSLDTVHLVIEGTNSREVSDDALLDPHIDVLSTHDYGPAERAIPLILKARERARGRKPFFVGEFGFIPTADMRRVIDTVINSGASGIMVWSLRTHNRDGGFYYHTNDYRWPGFPSGRPWDEAGVLSLFREKAYQINGKPPEPLPAPEAPSLLPIETPYKISWRGSTGASSYLIERKAEGETFWRVIAPRASDANIGYRPLYADTSAIPGGRYSYRIRAWNPSGYSDESEPVGPVDVRARMLIDEMVDTSKFYAWSGQLKFLAPNDLPRAKQDRSRVSGNTGDFIVYRLPSALSAVQVDVFAAKTDADTAIALLSGKGFDTLAVLPLTRQVFLPLKNEYGFYPCVRLSARDIPSDQRFLRIVLAEDCQVSRVEITFDALKQ